jgi:hypothetical protein
LQRAVYRGIVSDKTLDRYRIFAYASYRHLTIIQEANYE